MFQEISEDFKILPIESRSSTLVTTLEYIQLKLFLKSSKFNPWMLFNELSIDDGKFQQQESRNFAIGIGHLKILKW